MSFNKTGASRRKTKLTDDFFPTEPRFVDSLIKHTVIKGNIWEPACGEGDISERLKRTHGFRVVSSDLFNRGYGSTGVDFLKAKKTRAENIVTNPPFILFDEFVEKAWELGSVRKIAFISSVPNLASSQSRWLRVWQKFPPTKIVAILNKMDVRGSGKSIFNHCWIIWDKSMKKNLKTEFVWDLLPPNTKNGTVRT